MTIEKQIERGKNANARFAGNEMRPALHADAQPSEGEDAMPAARAAAWVDPWRAASNKSKAKSVSFFAYKRQLRR